jgi:RND family efflux transporter MFP subunit
MKSATLPPRRKIIVALFTTLLIGAIIVMGLITQQDKRQQNRPAEMSQEAVEVPLMRVTYTEVPQWLNAPGTVRAQWESDIASKVMGRIVRVFVQEGESVRRGQTLVELDARDLEAAIAQSEANLRAATVHFENARVTAKMESSLSAARIAEAQAGVQSAEAELKAAYAKLDLVRNGPRPQERTQAKLAVEQAKSNLELAESNLVRIRHLLAEGAISQQQYEMTKTAYEVAKTQYMNAQQTQSLADEGSRAEEIRAAQESVRQAQARVEQAYAALKQAQAAALQAEVRKQEIRAAKAQIGQAHAGLRMSHVARSYTQLTASFDGIITKRLADPGTMAIPGMPLLKVQGGSLHLEVIVPESVLPSLRIGLLVPVQLDALGKRMLAAKLVEISPAGDSNSHTFLVKVELPSDSGARVGMFGRARFRMGVEKQLLIPATAVWEHQGLHYVFAVDNTNVARLRLVTVGEAIGNRVPVLSGLKNGEQIVVTGREHVRDGIPVLPILGR